MAKLLSPVDLLVPGVADTLPGAPSSGHVRFYGGQLAEKPVLFTRAPEGRASAVQDFLGRCRVAWANPNGDSTTISVYGLTITSTGNTTAANVGNGSFYVSQRRVDALVTSASTTAVAGFRYNQSQWYRGDAAGRGGFLVVIRWGAATGVATSTTRGFCGMVSATGAPTDANPSAQNNCLGFGWDSGDANISFMHKTGSGSIVKETLSGSWARPSANETSVYECTIYSPPNGSFIGYEITNLTTGDTTRGSVTTDLPAQSTMLCPKVWMSVGGTSSVIGVSLMNLYIQSDT